MADNVRVDTSKALAKLRRVRGGVPSMSHFIMLEVLDQAARYMAMQPHQDTRRWSRAWIQAANMAGAKKVAIPPVGESRYWRDLYVAVKRFRDQQRELVRVIEAELALMFPKIPKNPTRGVYGKKLRALNRAKDRLRKSQIMLEAIGSDKRAIVLHAGKGAVFGAQGGSTRPPQVVTKVYGGGGSIVSDQRGALARLENYEAHARVVESQYRILAALKRTLGPMVLKGAGKKAIDAVRKAARAG